MGSSYTPAAVNLYVILYVLSFNRGFLGPIVGGVLVHQVGFPSMAAVRNRSIDWSYNYVHFSKLQAEILSLADMWWHSPHLRTYAVEVVSEVLY